MTAIVPSLELRAEFSFAVILFLAVREIRYTGVDACMGGPPEQNNHAELA